MMTTNEGPKRSERGIKRAAYFHEPQIRQDTLRFLDALLASPTGLATLDDATPDLHAKHADGGRWRAIIPKRLKAAGIIVAERITQSARSARHAGYLTVWKLVNRAAAEELRAVLAAETESPATQKALPGFDSIG